MPLIKICAAAFIILFLYGNSSGELSKNKFKTIPDTTYSCDVVTNSKYIYKNVNLYGFKDSSVKILNGSVSNEIEIKDIRSINFKGRGFWKGAAIGGAIGFGLGAIAGAIGVSLASDGSHSGSFGEAIGIGFIFMVPSALIGGGLGSLFAEDRFYDLSKMDFEMKQKMIVRLIKQYSDN